MAHVMVVDDDRHVRELLVGDLRDEGFVVVEADTAGAAVRLLHLEPVEVLVAEINLRGALTGVDLAVAARKRSPGLPIVFISTAPADPEVSWVISHPVSFLQKPFRLSALTAAVLAVAPSAQWLL